MRKIILFIFLLLSLGLSAQNNVYGVEKKNLQFGKHRYRIEYESFYNPEGKERGFSEVLIKKNKKQYLGSFVYQLKNDSEMLVDKDHPSHLQLENKILQSSFSIFDYENEQIIVTTNYYDAKESKEKEIKTLQQSEKGFFYVKQKQTYFKNGQIKEEKDLPQKIELMKLHF